MEKMLGENSICLILIMTDLIINTDNGNICCGTCKHNKSCENYLNHKDRTDWVCGLYQSGGSAIKQLNLFDDK